jgi:hypothetical protein
MTTTTDEDLNRKLIGLNHTKNVRSSPKGNGRSKDEENKPNHSQIAYKYSNDRKGPLHESIILAGIPMFIKHENGEAKVLDQIDEPSRIIRPPRKEECPYPPYEFANIEEVQEYLNEAKSTNIESLSIKAKEIVLKYVDQEEPIIIILTADIIWSYFQDLFATTHYLNVTGDNETGKSTIGHVFEYTGYRPVKASTISTANYYRTHGTIEPGQSTMIEDEADNIEEDITKLKNLKHTYEYNSKVPKVNMNTEKQNQNWFYGYCLKIIISEKPLSPTKAKGLVERMLTLHCKSAINENLLPIKEITMNPPGDPEKQKLYQELIHFRKLMLCYRLIHYMDHIPEIDTGLKNRDKELGGPLLRIFHDTKVFGDIKYALQKFLTERKVKKEKTIESALGPLIVKLVTENNTLKIHAAQIWDTLPNAIPGSSRNPNEYQTNEYGTLYRNTLPQRIVDAFGAVRERMNNGIVLRFDEEKIKELKMMYGREVQDSAKAKDAAPDAYTEPHNNESKNTLEDKSEGSEGYRICGFIIE